VLFFFISYLSCPSFKEQYNIIKLPLKMPFMPYHMIIHPYFSEIDIYAFAFCPFKITALSLQTLHFNKMQRYSKINISGWKCDDVDDCGDNSDESVNICRK
jgi:hypothetical protein